MEILLGATAIGSDGKLGEVNRFFIDPKSGRAEQMTIKPTLGEEHVVSLMRVTRVDGDRVYLDADHSAVSSAPRFDAHAYRVPGVDNEPTLSPRSEMPGSVSMQMQPGNLGSAEEWDIQAGKSGEPEFTPEDELEPMVSRDTEVLGAEGEKVGKVCRFGVDNVTGLATRLEIHAGSLFGHDVNIPLDQVQQYGPKGILLKLKAEDLKSNR